MQGQGARSSLDTTANDWPRCCCNRFGAMAVALPSRNLALELVRVTETAAIAASSWVGRGQKDEADQAAVDAMRAMINTVSMSGVIVIGEGEKDAAPMLFNGESVGNGSGPAVDVAVDPIDGTTLTSKGMANAISVIALAERGTMFDPVSYTHLTLPTKA